MIAILLRYKFCNSFRASDRVSQYLICTRHLWRRAPRTLRQRTCSLRIILFRLFSKESTWEALEDASSGLRVRTLDIERLARALDSLRERQSIYTAAFILCAHDAYGHRVKHRNHLELVRRMFARRRTRTQACQAHARSPTCTTPCVEWPMIGAFMGYQLAIDLNYSEHLHFSEDDFTMPGPGAQRGLQKVFSDFGGQTPAQLIMRMVDRQEEEFDRLGLQCRARCSDAGYTRSTVRACSARPTSTRA